jgi:hypothetical protein
MAFQKVDEPEAGTFVGWGNKKGQYVEGKVLDYAEAGGTDFAKNPCPLLEIELTKRAASFNKENERTNYEPGDVVNLTCGLANLKKYIKKVAREGLSRGNLIRIELVGFEKVPNGTVKLFEIQVDRSVEDTGTSPADEGGDGDDDGEPPF